jgi:hypothetical protein
VILTGRTSAGTAAVILAIIRDCYVAGAQKIPTTKNRRKADAQNQITSAGQVPTTATCSMEVRDELRPGTNARD